ncbi:MAG: hypothetical protein ACRCUT_05055, partial [Spirochaetota bacterium]
MKKIDISPLKDKFRSAVHWVRARKVRTAAACIIPLCIVALVLGLSLRKSYSLNPAVTHSIFTIPESAEYYIGVLHPQEFYDIFEKSAFGKSFISSQAWEKLAGTPEFQKLSNLFYYIELKAGLSISYKDMPSFLGGSAGFAKMNDGSILISAKTNLKSRMGIALATAFKGETVPLPKKDKKEKSKNLEGVTADTWTDIFAQEQIGFANLSVTKINVQNGFMYIVMLDDFLFVSDSIDTLEESLYLAAKPESSSLKNSPGMLEAMTAFEKSGQVLIYADSQRSIAAPVLSAFCKGDGAAVVLYPSLDKDLTGDIFAIGADFS